MTNEEEFKNKLNDLLSSKEFPFDESNWEKAQHLIDASRKSPWFLDKRLISIAAVLLVFVGTACYFIFDDSMTNPIPLNKKSIVANSGAAGAKNSEQTIIAKIEKQRSSNKKFDGKTTTVMVAPVAQANTRKVINETKNLEQSSTEKNESSISNLQKNTLFSNSKNEKRSQILKAKSNPIVRSESDKVSDENKLNANLKSERLKNKNKINIDLYSNPDQFSKNLNKNEIGNNNQNAPLTVEENKIVDESNKLETAKSENSKPIVENKTISVDQSNVPSEPASNAISNNSEFVMEKNKNNLVAIDSNGKEKIKFSELNRNPNPLIILDSNLTKAIIKDSAEKTNTKVSVDSSNSKTAKVKSYRKHRFSFELGTFYALGWKDNEGLDAKGFNPIGGLNYQLNFSPKFSLVSGFLYTSIGHIQNADYTAKRVTYTFGEDIDYTTISARRMYYVTVPLKLLYTYKVKNEIGLGFNASYLMDVNSEVINYSKRYNLVSEPLVTKTNGYRGGFNPYDLQLSLFYRRRILEKLSINTEFNFGLLDIKNNKYFKPTQFERNSGFRITLVYDIFNK